MTAGGRNVTTHDAAGMWTVTIDRAERRNALDRATLEALEAAFAAAAEDGDVRVIVLRGAGGRAFCAGADLAELLGHASLVESRRHFDGVARVIRAMERAPQPVIACVPALAEQLAGLSPLALRLGKEAVYTMVELEAGAALTYLRDAIVLTSRTEDARKEITAFFEKRRPRWTGR